MATLAPDLEVVVLEVRARLYAANQAINMGLDGTIPMREALANAAKLIRVAEHWWHYGAAPDA